MLENLLDKHRYTLMALLSAAILVGSGISLGVGLVESKGTKASKVAEVTEGTEGTEVAGIAEATDATEAREPSSQLININTASVDELDLLPGIGPAYAQRVVDYRESNGPFKSISEIQNVSGIGPKTFERIKDLVVIK